MELGEPVREVHVEPLELPEPVRPVEAPAAPSMPVEPPELVPAGE